MFTITKSIDIDFAHHVRGHLGACINIHGHTWRFEVTVGAEHLDDMGFVVDFAVLKRCVLAPCHRLLDHGLALPLLVLEDNYAREHLRRFGEVLYKTRADMHGVNAAKDVEQIGHNTEGTVYEFGYPVYGSINKVGLVNEPRFIANETLRGARNEIVGGTKVAGFPFSPTSERLAEWLYAIAKGALEDGRVRVLRATVYETLHPVKAFASYQPQQ